MALQGTLPVIPTPFIDGEIDYPSFQRMLDFFLPYVDGYTLCGSTGEAPSMSSKERMALVEFAMQHTPAEKTVVVGIAHTEARSALELARHAEAQGARGCLVPSPYYFANTKQGVRDYLAQIDRSINIDLVFYDNPFSTKTTWSVADLADLAAGLTHVRAIKMTDHNIEKIAWLKQNTNLSVFSGDDVVLYRSLLLGADGCMVIAPIICPPAYQESWQLLKAGNLHKSYAVYSRGVLPFIHMFGIGNEIVATKAIYQHMGIFASDEVRPPLVRCNDTWRKQLILSYETCRALERG